MQADFRKADGALAEGRCPAPHAARALLCLTCGGVSYMVSTPVLPLLAAASPPRAALLPLKTDAGVRAADLPPKMLLPGVRLMDLRPKMPPGVDIAAGRGAAPQQRGGVLATRRDGGARARALTPGYYLARPNELEL